jgi:hypothetical protein
VISSTSRSTTIWGAVDEAYLKAGNQVAQKNLHGYAQGDAKQDENSLGPAFYEET